jgi:hypothetical protein
MNKKYLILFSILILIFSQCKKKQHEQNTNINDSLKISINDSSYADSANSEDIIGKEKEKIVTDTQVIFFLPSPQSRQELIKFYGTYNQYEFQNIFSNFIDLSRSVKYALKSKKIPVEITYAKRFVFPLDSDTLVYDLEQEDQIMGYILFDGVNPPLIKNGLQKRKQVSNDLRNYFNLAKFKLSAE